MEKIIYGIQQVGLGVSNLEEVWKWYIDSLGFDVKIFDDDTVAELMLPYTGGEPQQRHAILALNLQGGGGLEIWQYKERTPLPPKFPVKLGDLGIFAAKIKSPDIEAAFNFLKSKGVILGDLVNSPEGKPHFYISDPFGNTLEVYEDKSTFLNEGRSTSGIGGAIVGVSQMERSVKFYSRVLGYDKVVYNKSGRFDDLAGLPAGNENFHRVLLTHSDTRKGSFSELFVQSYIELIQPLDRVPLKILQDRFWGDLGFIHLCFDVKNMDQLERECNELGFPFTVNSNIKHSDKGSFDMGEAAGHFTYIEDPDETLIEFVETHFLPIYKPLGIKVNFQNRRPYKSVPRWMIKLLRFKRVKKI